MKLTNPLQMTRLMIFAVLMAVMGLVLPGLAQAAESDSAAMEPVAQDWPFNGIFGKYDRAALQRGYQVYREVCSVCHGMKYIAFRNLEQAGGPEFTVEAVEALAAEFTIEDGPDDFGDMFTRPGKASDYFPSPYPNDNAARASSGGSLPPDLSLITKARAHGANYVYALLTGYEDAPADFELGDIMSYNPYFSGRQIAMAPPLFDELLEYSDGTPATVQQMASDVSSFLQWAAEPELEARKGMAQPTFLYLILLTALLYMSYKKLWRDVDHD